MAQSPTGGVKAFPIGGRLVRERERLRGMTDQERAWRKQYLKDQILSESEPRYVPEYWKEITNPIRRFYQWPLVTVENNIRPMIGEHAAKHVRFWTGKFVMFTFGIYAGYYYFKYHQNDWTRKRGWRVISSRTACLPGDEGYPKLSDRSKPSDYAARGFKDSPI
ncbi:CLUMA_CG013718, isoform A [Clunio marinus]|uniref:CLUMA_CG013718, isoform A n=1 Tax=Clunio marinus TaxID=568069 RepID=A0A1J1IJN1_9DIPT|nr:CLUMA_CG013718, isoform A [Clunio marinus]